ncbi:MAG: hypothetical protein QOG87_3934 [Actinomycetota bacterium]|jgi:hypothetical protein
MTAGLGRIMRAYDDGVEAVEAMATRIEAADVWDQPTPCPAWTAVELTGHLQVVVGWYHAWLDRAEVGIAEAPFPTGRLPAENAAAVDALPPTSGTERAAAFATSARAYAKRLPERWSLPYGYPRGTVTAGLHAGVAAIEWHVHAWDLGQVVGHEHRPADPEALAAVGAESEVRWRMPALRPLLPAARWVATTGDAWRRVLKGAGRAP